MATLTDKSTVETAPAIGRAAFVRTVTAGAAAAATVIVSSTASLAATTATAAVEVAGECFLGLAHDEKALHMVLSTSWTEETRHQ